MGKEPFVRDNFAKGFMLSWYHSSGANIKCGKKHIVINNVHLC